MSSEHDSTQTSRSRLLNAGKSLFARMGYEQTSTSAIAREAMTSESQLVRYFGGKSGLLEAIFNESWRPLTEDIQRGITEAANGKQAISTILSTLIESFGRDHELAFLFLFEGRRLRGGGQVVLLSQGFKHFYDLCRTLIRRGHEDGSFRRDFSEFALMSALMGAAEGMIRDRLMAERTGEPNPFTDAEIRQVFRAIVLGFSPPEETNPS